MVTVVPVFTPLLPLPRFTDEDVEAQGATVLRGWQHPHEDYMIMVPTSCKRSRRHRERGWPGPPRPAAEAHLPLDKTDSRFDFKLFALSIKPLNQSALIHTL